MARRVGVILSGCGNRDGSEIREALFTVLALERAGAQVIFAAPDVAQPAVVDHTDGTVTTPDTPRRVLSEAARIARGDIRSLSQLQPEDVDALVFPGGAGVATVLSNYAEKGVLCDVDPDVVRLLRGLLSAHKPMGFICVAPILAARVLGPAAGVRVTLGARGSTAAKHAAVMGADVRPCAADDVVVDSKARVVSTPAYMYETARLSEIAGAIDKLVRNLMTLAKGEKPRPPQPNAGPRALDAQRKKSAPAPRAPGEPIRRRPHERPKQRQPQGR